MWRFNQTTPNGPFTYWRHVGGTALTGSVTVTPAREGLRIFALDQSGTPQTAVYRASDGVVSAWVSLSDTGFIGSAL
jgi:hypothetical protein